MFIKGNHKLKKPRDSGKISATYMMNKGLESTMKNALKSILKKATIDKRMNQHPIEGETQIASKYIEMFNLKPQ